VCPRSEMDQHTYSCPFSKQYNAEAILARMAAAARDSSAADHNELYHAATRQKHRPSAARAAPEGTTIHYVARHDTLSGLALRYGACWPACVLACLRAAVFCEMGKVWR
jgi:hypothetical protein